MKKIFLGLLCFVFLNGCSKRTESPENTKRTENTESPENTERIDKNIFENLYRSAKAVEGAISVGVNYQKFGELLQNFATEISIMSDRVKTPNEQEVLKYYYDTLVIYEDSFKIWGWRFYMAQYPDSYGGLPSDEIVCNEGSMAEKYNLPTQSHPFYSGGKKYAYKTISEDSIQLLWTLACKEAKKANEQNLVINWKPSSADNKKASKVGSKDISGLFKGKLRSLPEVELSVDSIKTMFKDKGLFDSFYNKTASGFPNEYELQSDGKVVYDHASGLTWQRSGSDNSMSFDAKKEYVAQLNREGFAGYRDWRLPTLEETMSLVEPTEMNGGLYIDPLFDNKQTWILTSDFYSASRAWVVNFSHGYCNYGFVFDSSLSVRAVR